MTRTRRRPTAAGHTLKRNENPAVVPEENEKKSIPAETLSNLSNIPEEEEKFNEESFPAPSSSSSQRIRHADRLPKHPENTYNSPSSNVRPSTESAMTTNAAQIMPTFPAKDTYPGDNSMHLEMEQRYLTTDRHRKMAIAKHAHEPEK